MQTESSIGAPSGQSDSGANLAGGSPPSQDTFSAPANEQTAGSATAENVQGQSTTETQDDFAGVPTLDELKAEAQKDTPYAKSLIQLREAIEQRYKPQLTELQTKYEPYQSVFERFKQPDQLNSVLELHDNLIGWERDPSGELIPSTMSGAERLAKEYPLHADYLAADLLNMETINPDTGQRVTRMDLALAGIAQNKERRAEALRILGAVEPSSISPQWQATAEELEVVRPELQEVYKSLPYEERQELKLAAPDFINRTLEREKLTQELQAEREQSQSRTQQQQQQREQYINSQAGAAGEQYLQTQLTDALTTFHNSVVEQCNFIQPIDPQNPPQGMTAEQVQGMNAQIGESNKAEAAQITLAVVGLINEQTRPFVLPLLQQIGVIDDKLLKDMETAAKALGDNARNYGHLNFRGKLQSNGNGYQPDASVTKLGNEASRNLKLLAHFANQIKGRLMEKRSQFFSMKATDHNQTLNNVASSRQLPSGSTYNPTTAAPQRPQGWQSRQEIEAQYGG